MNNSALLKLLTELQEIYDILGDQYRGQSLRVAIAELKKIDFPITATTFEQFAAQKRAGIGPGMLGRIKEFVTSRHIAELDILRESAELRAHKELGKIVGVGSATVNKWLKLGVNSLPTLRKAIGAGVVKLNNMQKYGLLYYNDLNTRIPRQEVAAIGALIRAQLMCIDPDIIFEIAGSYRRGRADSGDIDILVSNRTKFHDSLLSEYEEILRADSNYVATLSSGPERLTFLYRYIGIVRQVDILNIAFASYYAALLYFTGSYTFNTKMRGTAKAKGYRLNQAGLYKVQKSGGLKLIPVTSEAHIFELLSYPYVAPGDRE